MSLFRRIRPLSLRMRIGVLLFAGVLLAGLGLYVLLVNLTRDRLTEELDTRVRGYTSLLATRLSTPLLLEDHAEMRSELRRALRDPSVVGIEVFDHDGAEFERLVRDRRRWKNDLAAPMDTVHAPQDVARLARLGARQVVAPIERDPRHASGVINEARELYGLGSNAPPGGEISLGWVRAIYSTELVDRTVRSAARMGLTVLLAALALWLVPLMGLLRFITDPLREASELAQAIAHGELERRIPVRSPDELGMLAGSLNTMAGALTEAREDAQRESMAMRRATQAVVSISRGAREAGGVDAVFEVVASQLRQLTGSEGAALALADDSEHQSRLRRFDPPEPWGEVTAGFPVDAELLHHLESTPGPVLLEFDRGGLGLVRALRREGYRRGLIVPLQEADEGRSSILLVSQSPDAFTPSQIEVVVGLASHLASALHASELHARLESAVEELDRTREQLEHSERMRVAGEMASGVAHDFNNVLGAILGRAQLLRRQADAGALPTEDLRHALEVIERAAMDGSDTVRRLRQFGPGGRAPETEVIDLDDAVRGAAEFTRPRWESEAQARGCSIAVEIRSQAGALVAGRGSELREIFTNLILNSIDALPDGGSIRLTTSMDAHRVIATVEDDGIGMSETVRKRIFDPFFTTKGERGTGLGLSVVYGIVQGARGHISVRSAPGRGTQVRIEFPRASPVETPVPLPSPRVDAVSPLRIMVVDDEPAVRELLQDILHSLGHSSTVFASGGEALDQFEPGRWDLVFTDLGMPGMTGWELSRAVRARDPGVTIAIITGWGADVNREALSAAGADAVVGKPFSIEDVEGLVHLALGRMDRAA